MKKRHKQEKGRKKGSKQRKEQMVANNAAQARTARIAAQVRPSTAGYAPRGR